MMARFIYQNKKTGFRVYSDSPIDRDDLVLVSEIKNSENLWQENILQKKR